MKTNTTIGKDQIKSTIRSLADIKTSLMKDTNERVARNVVHRAKQFTSSKKLKGAEDYIISRFNHYGPYHLSRREPRLFAQSWLFEFLTRRLTSTPKTTTP